MSAADGVSPSSLLDTLQYGAATKPAQFVLVDNRDGSRSLEGLSQLAWSRANNSTVVILGTAEATLQLQARLPSARTIFIAGTGASDARVDEFDHVISGRPQHQAEAAAHLRTVLPTNGWAAPAENTSLLWPTRHRALSHYEALYRQHRLGDIATVVRRQVGRIEAARVAIANPAVLRATDEDLYILETRITSLFQQLNERTPTSISTALEYALRSIMEMRDNVFMATVKIEQASALTQPRPLKLYRWTNKKWALIDRTELHNLYENKLVAFAAKGGNLERREHLSLEFLSALDDGELCEFAVTAEDGARIARAADGLGHLILAGGNDVLTAGSLKVFRGNDNSFRRVELGTFSGSYLTPKESLQVLADILIEKGVPEHVIFTTENEAASPRVHDIMGKLSKTAAAEHEARTKQVVAIARAWDVASVNGIEDG